VKPGDTPLGGLSGGAITAIQTCAGVPFEQQLMGFKMILSFCQTNYKKDPYCGGILGALIKQSVLMNIKTFGHMKPHERCQDKLFVSLSALDPLATTLMLPKSWTISNFTSIEDMVDIVGGTCFLSCFMGPTPYTVARNTPVIDGGYTSGWAQFCPPNAKRCIKLSAFTIGPNNPTGKVPNCDPAAGSTTSKPPAVLSVVPRNLWKLPDTCTYDSSTQAITGPQQPPFVPADSPDIYPGFLYNSLKHDPCVWQSWAMSVLSVTPEVVQAMHDQGAADAMAWLAANTVE
jgi:hypothetical protein